MHLRPLHSTHGSCAVLALALATALVAALSALAEPRLTSSLRSCYVEGEALNVSVSGWARNAEVSASFGSDEGDSYRANDAGLLDARLPIDVRGHGEKVVRATFTGHVNRRPTLSAGARVSYDARAWGSPGAYYSDDVADGGSRLHWYHWQGAREPTYYRIQADGGRHFWSADGWEWTTAADGTRTREPFAPQGSLAVPVRVSSRSVAILPGKARPTQRVRFEARGFTVSKPLYAHYVRRAVVVRRGGRRVVQRSKAIKTVHLGTPRGACGVLRTKARILPFKWPRARGPKQQVLDAQYDHVRKYRPRSTGVVDRSELIVRRSGRGYIVSVGAPNRL